MEQSLVLPKDERQSLVTRAGLYLKNVRPHITIETMNKEVQKRLPGDETMETIAKEWSWLTREQIMESRWLEGRQEGLAEGLSEGYRKASHKNAERLIIKGMSDVEISEVTELALDEIKQLKDELNPQR